MHIVLVNTPAYMKKKKHIYIGNETMPDTKTNSEKENMCIRYNSIHENR